MKTGFGSKYLLDYKLVLKHFDKVFKAVEQLDEATDLSKNGLREALNLLKKGQINKEELKRHFLLAIESLNLDKEENLALKKLVPGFEESNLKDQVIKSGLTTFQRLKAVLEQDVRIFIPGMDTRTKAERLAACSDEAHLASISGNLGKMIVSLAKLSKEERNLEIAKKGILPAIDHYKLSVDDITKVTNGTSPLIEAIKHNQTETLKRFLNITKKPVLVWRKGHMNKFLPMLKRVLKSPIIMEQPSPIRNSSFADAIKSVDLKTMRVLVHLGILNDYPLDIGKHSVGDDIPILNKLKDLYTNSKFSFGSIVETAFDFGRVDIIKDLQDAGFLKFSEGKSFYIDKNKKLIDLDVDLDEIIYFATEVENFQTLEYLIDNKILDKSCGDSLCDNLGSLLLSAINHYNENLSSRTKFKKVIDLMERCNILQEHPRFKSVLLINHNYAFEYGNREMCQKLREFGAAVGKEDLKYNTHNLIKQMKITEDCGFHLWEPIQVAVTNDNLDAFIYAYKAMNERERDSKMMESLVYDAVDTSAVKVLNYIFKNTDFFNKTKLSLDQEKTDRIQQILDLSSSELWKVIE